MIRIGFISLCIIVSVPINSFGASGYWNYFNHRNSRTSSSTNYSPQATHSYNNSSWFSGGWESNNNLYPNEGEVYDPCEIDLDEDWDPCNDGSKEDCACYMNRHKNDIDSSSKYESLSRPTNESLSRPKNEELLGQSDGGRTVIKGTYSLLLNSGNTLQLSHMHNNPDEISFTTVDGSRGKIKTKYIKEIVTDFLLIKPRALLERRYRVPPRKNMY